MSCESWHEALVDRVADEISEERTILLEQHLAECAACTEELQRLERLIDSTRIPDDGTVDPGMEDRLVGAWRRQHAARAPASWWAALWQRRVPAYAIVAVALIGVMAGTQLGRHGTRTDQATPVGESHRVPPPPAMRTVPPEGTLQASLPQVEFATTPSDAISTGRLGSPDSL
jgi:anti-sigma factor RsiW